MDESYLAAEVFPAGVPWTTGSSSPACDTHFMICGILTRRLGHPTTDMLEAMDFLGWRDLEGQTADCSTSVAFDPELVAVMALLDLDDPLLKCFAGSWRTSSGASISIGPSIVKSWWCGESTTPPGSSSLCAGSATPAGSSSSCAGSATLAGSSSSCVGSATPAGSSTISDSHPYTSKAKIEVNDRWKWCSAQVQLLAEWKGDSISLFEISPGIGWRADYMQPLLRRS